MTFCSPWRLTKSSAKYSKRSKLSYTRGRKNSKQRSIFSKLSVALRDCCFRPPTCDGARYLFRHMQSPVKSRDVLQEVIFSRNLKGRDSGFVSHGSFFSTGMHCTNSGWLCRCFHNSFGSKQPSRCTWISTFGTARRKVSVRVSSSSNDGILFFNSLGVAWDLAMVFVFKKSITSKVKFQFFREREWTARCLDAKQNTVARVKIAKGEIHYFVRRTIQHCLKHPRN